MTIYEKHSEHQAVLVEIHDRWRDMPAKMRVAYGIDDACQDWPIASFGDDDRKHGEAQTEAWLCTDGVRCSEFAMSCPEVADALAKAPQDIRALYRIIAELRELVAADKEDG